MASWVRFVSSAAIAAALLFAIGTGAVQGASEGAGSDTLKPMPELLDDQDSDRFPGDPPEHRVVYMFNKADEAYQTAILNSISALITQYDDNVAIAVVAIGPGLHVLGKIPERPATPSIYERVENLAKHYNVRWIACGNTMHTLGWAQSDIRPFAEYAEVGAAALMALQEDGFAYIN
ncbi:MAG TPA: hypothetical protein DD979_03370 [Gammaproteobacteria bacterium]|nr:hypothetical protein [Gammaproteobacteria bacterium]